MSSGDTLHSSQKQKIGVFIKSFLDSSQYRQIREYHENLTGGWWGALFPFLEVAYHPYCTSTESSNSNEVLDLKLLCIEMGIFSLQVALLGEKEKLVLTKEGSLDFVVCLPWCLPQGSRAQQQAVELVSYLRHEKQLVRPPSLLNIAKAKLAAMCFGLKKMINSYSIQDLLS